MALPATYGPEANDTLDARIAKMSILMWQLANGQITIPVSTASGGSAIDVIELGGNAITTGAGAVAAGTLRATLASNDPAVAALGNIESDAVTTATATSSSATSLTSLQAAAEGDYETVAAGQTDQILGPTGAVGDYLSGLLVIPATTSPGAVSIEDGATNIPVFTGGANSVSNLVPFFIPLGIRSVSGGWEVTTGTNVAVIGIGKFT